MEYDETYGAIACAQQPFNTLIVPFAWLYFVIKDDQALKRLNRFLCHLMYFPVAITLTALFAITNTLFTPIALLNHIVALRIQIMDSYTANSTNHRLIDA